MDRPVDASKDGARKGDLLRDGRSASPAWCFRLNIKECEGCADISCSDIAVRFDDERVWDWLFSRYRTLALAHDFHYAQCTRRVSNRILRR